MEIDKNWSVEFPRKFFTDPFKMGLDLNRSQFEDWKKWFFEDLVKCDTWSCVRDGDDHAIYDMCGCGSIYDTYRSLADYIIEQRKSEEASYFPMYDPIYAHHLPDSGWTRTKDGVTGPVIEDDLEEWPQWFPKRSCVSCNGRYGDTREKICSHEDTSKCVDSCFKKVFQSWCPLMNNFMEKKGWNIDRSLEKYSKDAEARELIQSIGEEAYKDFKTNVPPAIQEFLKKSIEEGENKGNGRNNGSNN